MNATTSIETTIAFANNFVLEPMPDPANPIRALENLLKYPDASSTSYQTRAAILARLVSSESLASRFTESSSARNQVGRRCGSLPPSLDSACCSQC